MEAGEKQREEESGERWRDGENVYVCTCTCTKEKEQQQNGREWDVYFYGKQNRISQLPEKIEKPEQQQ